MITHLDQHPLSARTARHALVQAFKDAGLPFAEDDAGEIIEAATGMDRTAMVLRGETELDSNIIAKIKAHMERRLSGEPVDHILGWREFFGRRFQISKDVLSPRADTETLIRGALHRLDNNTPQRLLDLGTGSGAIGLTLLAERENCQLLATDLSEAALQIARLNAQSLSVISRAEFSHGPWWEAVPKTTQFNMILSNPPYISNVAMKGLEAEVLEFDPDLALRGGDDGLDAYRTILIDAKHHLNDSGWIGFEIGFDQAAALTKLLSDQAWDQITVDRDLGGNDRAVWAKKRPFHLR